MSQFSGVITTTDTAISALRLELRPGEWVLWDTRPHRFEFLLGDRAHGTRRRRSFARHLFPKFADCPVCRIPMNGNDNLWRWPPSPQRPRDGAKRPQSAPSPNPLILRAASTLAKIQFHYRRKSGTRHYDARLVAPRGNGPRTGLSGC